MTNQELIEHLERMIELQSSMSKKAAIHAFCSLIVVSAIFYQEFNNPIYDYLTVSVGVVALLYCLIASFFTVSNALGAKRNSATLAYEREKQR